MRQLIYGDIYIKQDINDFFQTKLYSETIPVKSEPENNYDKKDLII